MNIIWRGVNSDDINGLIVCELPPITKPKMKVKETHIDGVDGSIFEELGYESYDKTVSIGLKGNYDIDEVIDYFSGEGQVVFGNEPDKFYNARIVGQIDYQKLLRFRTANIRFRVQPFKYSNEEGKKTFDITSQTSINVFNNGNYQSKPKIRITGSGAVGFILNGASVFTYTFPNGDSYVDVDCSKQDAYVGSTLKNRAMNGAFPVFKVGKNVITWTGTITKLELWNCSRWL